MERYFHLPDIMEFKAANPLNARSFLRSSNLVGLLAPDGIGCLPLNCRISNLVGLLAPVNMLAFSILSSMENRSICQVGLLAFTRQIL